MTDPALVAANQAAPDGQRSSQVSRLVDDVVAVLQLDLSRALDVGPMPDKLQDYDLGQREGAVLVHYRGSDYRAGSQQSQPRTLAFDVHLLLRGLNGPLGAIVLVEDVRLALQGRQLQGCEAIVITKDGLVQEKDGIWNYVVSFTAALPAVARRHPDWRPY